jgi:hypothetical protein
MQLASISGRRDTDIDKEVASPENYFVLYDSKGFEAVDIERCG